MLDNATNLRLTNPLLHLRCLAPRGCNAPWTSALAPLHLASTCAPVVRSPGCIVHCASLRFASASTWSKDQPLAEFTPLVGANFHRRSTQLTLLERQTTVNSTSRSMVTTANCISHGSPYTSDFFSSTTKTNKIEKKRLQRLTQIAYYQSGKIVIQTLLPLHPPVALITLNLSGVTTATSADTYIPIDGELNTSWSSFLESRLMGLYGGKASSLLLNRQHLLSIFSEKPKYHSVNVACTVGAKGIEDTRQMHHTPDGLSNSRPSEKSIEICVAHTWEADTEGVIKTFDAPTVQRGNASTCGANRRCTAGALQRSCLFQSNIGTEEIQTATFLAAEMVNRWALSYLCTCGASQERHLHPYAELCPRREPSNYIFNLAHVKRTPQVPLSGIGSSMSASSLHNAQRTYGAEVQRCTPKTPSASLKRTIGDNSNAPYYRLSWAKQCVNKVSDYSKLETRNKYNRASAVSLCTLDTNLINNLFSTFGAQYKLNTQAPNTLVDKVPQYQSPCTFGAQSIFLHDKTNYVAMHLRCTVAFTPKVHGTFGASYSPGRFSSQNVATRIPLRTHVFQLLSPLQFSISQRDRFYPGWFRLYLPDIEATEFTKNVSNYYYSQGLQTLTRASSIFDRTGAVNVENPIFLVSSFSGKNMLKQVSFNAVSFVSTCGASAPVLPKKVQRVSKILDRCTNSLRKKVISEKVAPYASLNKRFDDKRQKKAPLDLLFTKRSCSNTNTAHIFSQGNREAISSGSCISSSLQKLPFDYNDVFLLEKELIFHSLINNCFSKAFSLIDQNRQLTDYFADYLVRFQILRQHQILYLFSTVLVSCKKQT